MPGLGSWFPELVEALRPPQIVEQELQRAEDPQCSHADVDWKAIRTTMCLAFERDYVTNEPFETPVILQWCTVCHEWEVITVTEYNARRQEEGKAAIA